VCLSDVYGNFDDYELKDKKLLGQLLLLHVPSYRVRCFV